MLYSHIQLHNAYTNICGNIVNNNDDFNERTNTLLYKNISLTLYSRKGWCWLCVRGELETGTDCYILTQSSSDHSSTSSSSWLGLLNRGSLRAQSHLSVAGSHAGILSPTDSNSNWLKLSVSWLYFCLTPTGFRRSSAYLHWCISFLWKCMNFLIPFSYGLNSTTTLLLQGWLWHWILQEG